MATPGGMMPGGTTLFNAQCAPTDAAAPDATRVNHRAMRFCMPVQSS
jgi:hypothetical protein